MEKTIIGVAGLKPDQIPVMSSFNLYSEFQLFLGFQVSYKSLRGLTVNPEYRARMLSLRDVEHLSSFGGHVNGGRLFILHYNPSGMSWKHREIYFDIATLLGKRFVNGLQINGGAPIELIEEVRQRFPHKTLIYQFNPEKSDFGILPRLVELRSKILFDASGGRGKPLDVSMADSFLEKILSIKDGFGKAIISGGLGPTNLEMLDPLLKKHGRIHTDAEGQLLESDKTFSTTLAIRYALAQSLKQLGTTKQTR